MEGAPTCTDYTRLLSQSAASDGSETNPVSVEPVPAAGTSRRHPSRDRCMSPVLLLGLLAITAVCVFAAARTSTDTAPAGSLAGAGQNRDEGPRVAGGLKGTRVLTGNDAVPRAVLAGAGAPPPIDEEMLRRTVLGRGYDLSRGKANGRLLMPLTVDKNVGVTSNPTYDMTVVVQTASSTADVQNSMAVSIGAEKKFAGQAFTASAELGSIRNSAFANGSNRRYTHVFRRETYATANVFVSPNVTEDFAAASAALPEGYSEAPYLEFIYKFGTHYVAEITLGGIIDMSFVVEESYWSSAQEQGFSAEAGIQGAFNDACVDAKFQKDTKASDAFKKALTDSKVSARGGDPASAGTWETWAKSVEGFLNYVDYQITSTATLMPTASRRDNMNRAIETYMARCPADKNAVTCGGRGTCDPVAGTCMCDKGYSGNACEEASCPVGTGNQVCSDHGSCNRSTGRCSCSDNWTHADCSVCQIHSREFRNPTIGGIPVDHCYGNDCHSDRASASAWCKRQGCSDAESFNVGSVDESTNVLTGGHCNGRGFGHWCDGFLTITCNECGC